MQHLPQIRVQYWPAQRAVSLAVEAALVIAFAAVLASTAIGLAARRVVV